MYPNSRLTQKMISFEKLEIIGHRMTNVLNVIKNVFYHNVQNESKIDKGAESFSSRKSDCTTIKNRNWR